MYYSSISERHLIQSPLVHCYGKLQNRDFPRRTLAFSRHCTILICSSSGRITVIGPISRYREVSDRGVPLSGLTVQSVHQRISRSLLSHPSQSLDYPRDTNPIRGLMYADDVAVLLT
ncbi:hypothetical protein BASA83_013729 [Batrachochytrium salamandrivorans]|nr:hypothetical protein BASA83_013729 [Batrachochytrium salamandrivorans]